MSKAANSKKAVKGKVRGIPFKKGQSGNPEGRKKLPPELNAVRNASKPQIIEAYGKYSVMSVSETEIQKPKNLIEMGILAALKEFSLTGNASNISKIWDQVHGKPVQPIFGDNDEPIEIRFVD